MKKNILKFALDAVMGIVFALLFNTSVLGGLTFHEIAGLAIGGAVVFHLLLNTKWIKKVTIGIFSPKTKAKNRLCYILNVLLLIDLLVIIITGVLISKVLFPTLGTGGNNHSLAGIHTAASYIGLLLIGVHVGLHRQWIISTCRNVFKIKGHSKARMAVVNVLAAAVLVFGIYSMTTTDFIRKATTFNQGEQMGMMSGDSNGMPDASGNGNGGGTAPDGTGNGSGGGPGASGTALNGSNGGKGGSGSGRQGQSSSDTTSGTGSATNTGTTADTGTAQGNSNATAPDASQMPSDAAGQNSQNGQHGMDGQSGGKGDANANPLQVAITFLSEIAAFAIATAYIEKLVRWIRRPKSPANPPNVPGSADEQNVAQ